MEDDFTVKRIYKSNLLKIALTFIMGVPFFYFFTNHEDGSNYMLLFLPLLLSAATIVIDMIIEDIAKGIWGVIKYYLLFEIPILIIFAFSNLIYFTSYPINKTLVILGIYLFVKYSFIVVMAYDKELKRKKEQNLINQIIGLEEMLHERVWKEDINMRRKFIEQSIILLKSNDIQSNPLQIINVERIEGDNEFKVNDSTENRIPNKSNINDENIIIIILSTFSILETYLEALYPNLQEQSFEKKYVELPYEIECQITVREVYRLLRLLRNACINGEVLINGDLNKIKAKYGNYHNECKLIIGTRGLDLICNYVLEFLKPNRNFTINHTNAFRVSLYSEIHNEIEEYKDEIEFGLKDIENKVELIRGIRYKVHNVDFKVSNDWLKIRTPYNVESGGVDYFIQYKHETYLIPKEILKNETILLNNLKLWKIM